ncbi:MAG: peptidoglycan DD-metalloendopeptidase family protein [Myxococcota bacterium]
MIQPPYGKPWLLYALLGSSLALNVLMVLDRDDDDAVSAPTVAAPTDDAPTGDDAGDDATPAAPSDAEAPSPDADTEDLAQPPPPVANNGGWQFTEAKVQHSLARTIQNASQSEHADALSAVYARLFMWNLDMRRDLQRNDRVRVAWRVDDDGTVEIAAATLRSRKYGKTLTAYRWQAPGDQFPSYWQIDGTEVSPRLNDSPLDEYEQITSLLKDRPDHEGMDFKTPIGTPVQTPRAGKVTRVNWNWASNGNCVEVKFDDGVVAKFLHLSDLKTSVGARVQKGQVIALTGNTGHSTAPHLHYQLEKGAQILDPVDYHGHDRRHLTNEVMPAFLKEVERLNGLLGGT